ncbi:MAG: hypothetical protein WC298_10700 [Sideroxydans sp.]|jgi:hypothetical protein
MRVSEIQNTCHQRASGETKVRQRHISLAIGEALLPDTLRKMADFMRNRAE